MAQEILSGPERRRRWTDEQKLSILREAGHGDLTVADVARRHDITRQHIYQWRSAQRRGRLSGCGFSGFVPVDVSTAAEPAPTGVSDGTWSDIRIEVGFSTGRVLRAPAAIAPALLTGLIRAIEAA